MSESRLRYSRSRNLVGLCVLLATLPVAFIRVLFMYSSPEVSEHDMRNIRPPASVLLLQGSTTPTLKTSANSTDHNTTAAAKELAKIKCDVSHGRWVADPTPPIYTNETCWQIQDTQNCLRNGRPDTKFLYWKWKPDGLDCETLQPNATRFLDSMRGKRLAFVGDSIARNQMQSLLCILTQVEKPKNTYHSDDDKTNHWVFPSYSFVLTINWSPYLVRESSLQLPGTNVTMTQLDLDVLGPWVESIAGTNAIVISSGQWFFKPAVYKHGGRVIGCHHCRSGDDADGLEEFEQLGFFRGYQMAVHTVFKELVAVPGFKGVSILRTFAPDHFENGLWDTGGTCPREEPGEVPMTEMNQLMHAIEVSEFKKATTDDQRPSDPKGEPQELAVSPRGGRIQLLDITEMAQLRPDGHPGPYRNFHPYDKDSASNFQVDCLHWCLPGPIDTWNEMLMESLMQQEALET